MGAGRIETVRLLFGADARSGTIELDGVELNISSPSHAIEEGICLLTEDRMEQGLKGLSENFSLPNLKAWLWIN